MKKIFYAFIIILFICGIIGVIYNSNFNNTNRNVSNSDSSKNTLISINSTNLEDKILNDKSDFFIYVGRPSCPYCKIFLPNLKKSIINEDYSVYYYNTDEQKYDERFDKVLTQLNITSVPILIYMKDGQTIDIIEFDEGSTEEKIKKWIKNISM